MEGEVGGWEVVTFLTIPVSLTSAVRNEQSIL